MTKSNGSKLDWGHTHFNENIYYEYITKKYDLWIKYNTCAGVTLIFSARIVE